MSVSDTGRKFAQLAREAQIFTPVRESPGQSRVGLCGLGCRGGGAFSRSGSRASSAPPQLLLSIDELTILRGVEIKQCPTGSKVLDESHADGVRGAGG